MIYFVNVRTKTPEHSHAEWESAKRSRGIWDNDTLIMPHRGAMLRQVSLAPRRRHIRFATRDTLRQADTVGVCLTVAGVAVVREQRGERANKKTDRECDLLFVGSPCWARTMRQRRFAPHKFSLQSRGSAFSHAKNGDLAPDKRQCVRQSESSQTKESEQKETGTRLRTCFFLLAPPAGLEPATP